MIRKIVRFICLRLTKILSKDKGSILETKVEFEKFADRYCKYANVTQEMSVAHICSDLRVLTHVIEKGLTFSNIKKGFGKEKTEAIVDLLRRYEKMGDYSFDYQAYENGIKILKTYASYKDKYELQVDHIDIKYLENEVQSDLGVNRIDYSRGINSQKLTFNEFALSRHSIRTYNRQVISDEEIMRIIKLAQTAPTACNRQDIKVFCIKNIDKIKKIMKLHQGAKGFDVPSCIMLVASDLRMYSKYEMSLPYFDGGLFTMNLLYAIHYFGYASCPLIWEDCCNGEILREIIEIPENYLVNIIITVGGMPEHPVVAVSKKRDVEEIVEIV